MGTMANAGTVEATGGTLDLAGSVDPASSGLFAINTASLLEIAADTYPTPCASSAAAANWRSMRWPVWLIDNYAPGTGLLQLRNGAVVATLAFQNSSLGAGSFHIDDDGSGHVLVSHHV